MKRGDCEEEDMRSGSSRWSLLSRVLELEEWRGRRRGLLWSSLQRINRIRVNPWLRRREGEKDQFALKWVRWRNRQLEWFLIVGSRRAKRQKWSARRDLSNEPKNHGVWNFFGKTPNFLKLQTTPLLGSNTLGIKRNFADTILTLKETRSWSNPA